ncbi:MAG: UDP-N-acetylglucosamine 2-epimerase (non-hydrolyzing) [Verrucomicrobia bacterium]|nr:UDP-N-acetylglucosamine 2-epimerase (non-hydrolyzing) [Verrucomicrobiota bacterium]
MKFVIFLTLTIQLFLGAQQPVVIFFGTRPEAIKLLPLQIALQKENVPTFLCCTGQHQELLHPIFDLFEVRPDIDFSIMKKDQDLFYITETVLQKAKTVISEMKPSLVVVQGDTTTAMASALAAFYLNVPVAHVEAGLRTDKIDRPFPEELNRRIISLVASYHFAPTEHAASQLTKEGVKKESIFLTGNTVVDALLMIKEGITQGKILPSEPLVKLVKEQKQLKHQLMLFTTHRRESIVNGAIMDIFQALKQTLTQNPNLHVIFPVHPNPQIQEAVKKLGLDRLQNLSIIPAVPYAELVYLLNEVDIIATDSGGIQEEAVSLNKPVLVLREETDRPEGLDGSAILIGTNSSKIASGIQNGLKLENSDRQSSIYGDGKACQRITEIIKGVVKK